MSSNRRRGFILEQFLLTLLVISLFLPLEITLLRLVSKHDFFNQAMQDEIALAQLRRVMNLCYDKNIEHNQVTCRYQEENINVLANENYLYITPGTWIFLVAIEDVYFYEENQLLMMFFSRDKVNRTVVLSDA